MTMYIEPKTWVRLPKKAKYVRVAAVHNDDGLISVALEFRVNGRELA